MNKPLLILLAAFFSVIAQPSFAAQDFQTWLTAFKKEAAAKGVSQKTINEALTGIEPINRVIELDRRQPESKITFAQYKKNIVNQQRINRGRELMQQHSRVLRAIEQAYGVQAQYIVALWGIETNFGTNTGGFKIVPALATLAWEGRRAEFFKGELLKALQIIDEGHISAADMKGSWAGAMGQNQFMPSSFLNFAVDGDGDGHKDIWNTQMDVFASSANYLKKSGWTPGQRWGRKVILPKGFNADLIGPKTKKPLTAWAAMGIKNPNGSAIPNENMMASVVAPDGLGGETYIVYSNYQTIMLWNRSTYFATSVGLLADAIAAGPRLPHDNE